MYIVHQFIGHCLIPLVPWDYVIDDGIVEHIWELLNKYLYVFLLFYKLHLLDILYTQFFYFFLESKLLYNSLCLSFSTSVRKAMGEVGCYQLLFKIFFCEDSH